MEMTIYSDGLDWSAQHYLPDSRCSAMIPKTGPLTDARLETIRLCVNRAETVGYGVFRARGVRVEILPGNQTDR